MRRIPGRLVWLATCALVALAWAVPARAQTWVLAPSADTWVDEAAPASANGFDTFLYTGGPGGGRNLTVLAFDVSPVPAGATVTSATLFLEVLSPDAGGNPVRVHPVTAPWSEATATWDSLAGRWDSLTVDASFTPSVGGVVAIDVTARVQAWVDGVSPPFGFVLEADPGAGQAAYGSREFAAFAPRLVVSTVFAAGALRVATGWYTGDGASNHAITGVGFAPDFVLVRGALGSSAWVRTATMPGGKSKALDLAQGFRSQCIRSLDADGFSVGNDPEVNAAGTRYDWIAVRGAPGAMALGSYTGNGASTRTISGVGFSPRYVMVLGDTASPAIQRFDTEPAGWALPFDYAGAAFGVIDSFTTDGFVVTGDVRVNAPGATYDWIAFGPAAGVATGSYTGWGFGPRSITDPGFAPEVVFVKSVSGVGDAVFRSSSWSNNVTGRLDTGFYFTDGILALTSTGFDVGAANETNALGETYRWLALAGSAAPETTDVAVAASATPPSSPPGGAVSVTVDASNAGPGTAAGVGVRVSLPPAFHLVSSGATAGAFDAGSGLWAIGSIAGGSTETLTLVGNVAPTALAGDTLRVPARLDAIATVDPDTTNDAATATIVVTGGGYRAADGVYVGDGSPLRAIAGLGFRPDVVLVTGEGGTSTVLATSSMPPGTSRELGTTSSPVGDGIVSLDADGFSVGANAAVNQGGVRYHWSAFRAAPGQLAVGAYVGDGVDNRSITGLGLSPRFAMVASEGSAAAVHRFGDQLGDASFSFTASNVLTDRIQAFEPDGFQVGKNASVNAPGTIYHYVAWGDSNALVATGLYVGDATDNRPIGGAGFAASLVWVRQAAKGGVTVAHPGTIVGDTTLVTAGGAPFVDGIQSITADGFVVGTRNEVNRSGRSYYWLALRGDAVADVAVGLAASPGVADVGDTLTWTVTATNAGPDSTSRVDVAFVPPAGTTFLSASPTRGTYSPLSGTWNVGPLGAGAKATLTVQTRADSGTGGSSVDGSAAIVFDAAIDPVSTNDAATASVYVRAADASVVVLPDTAYALAGDTVSWSVRLANTGPDDARGLVVRPWWDAAFTLLSAQPDPGGAWDSTGAWSVDTLAAGRATSLHLSARVDSAGAAARWMGARITAAAVEDPQRANDADSTTIAVVMPPSLDDTPASAWPASAFAGQAGLALRIGVDELDGVDVALDTATTIAFGPPAARAVAHLANPTLVPAGARDFVLAFSPTNVPAAIPADTTWSFTLALSGATPEGLAWAETLSTAGTNAIAIDAPAVRVEATPLAAESAMPGARDRDVLALSCINGTTAPRSLARLAVTLATSGPGTPAQRAAETPRWRLWADVDSSGTHTPADTLLAAVAPSTTLAVFDTIPGWSVAPGATGRLVVTADIDSSLARDGDVVDAVVVDAGDVVFAPPAPLADPVDPLSPLDSWGSVRIDGMPAHRLVVRAGADTLTSGQTDGVLAEIVVPPDGYAPDTLRALALTDAAGAFDPGDLDAVRLVLDDGDGAFDAARDSVLAPMAWTGDRWAASGLAVAVAAPRRLFVVGDVTLVPRNGDVLRARVPIDGVTMASDDDGPIDAPVDAARTTTFVALDHVEVTALPVAAAVAYPGASNVALLAFSVRNATPSSVTLDSIVVRNATTGIGSSAERDADVAAVRLVRDDGSGAIDAADTVLDAAPFAGGVATLRAGVALAPGAAATFVVAVDVDSTCAIDGDSLGVRVASSGDVHVTGAPLVAGDFPMETAARAPVDAMVAHQVHVVSAADSAIVSQPVDNVVLQFDLPANGARDDTLTALTVVNLGTATTDHVARLRLWRDGGDGAFDAGTGDDRLVGDFTATAKSTWRIAPLAEPLASACSGTPARFHVTADLVPSPPSGASVQFAIPVDGVTVASDADGPIDRPVFDPAVAFIPRPNEVTVFPYSVGDATVYPGTADRLNFGVGFYNGFDNAVRLDALDAFQRGGATASEIGNVRLWADADTNGLFDPAADAVLAAAERSGAIYTFDSLGVDLAPRAITYLFVTYDAALDARDSVDVDFQVNSDADIAFAGKSVTLRGEFPVNSPGVDRIDGMVRAQIAAVSPPSGRVAPGDADVPLLGLTVPSNGFLSDVLRSIAVRNAGSAAPGADVAALELWNDDGDGAFDPARDALVATLVWTGAQWVNAAPLSVTIPTQGLSLWVSADIAPGASDGRTVQAVIPVGGITVASGNDGPLDAAVTSTGVQTISTDPLLAQVQSAGSRWTVGQTFAVTMRARNVGTTALSGVHPGTLAVSGTGAVTVLSGPVPPSADLAAGADTTFTWTLRADAPGEVTLCAGAYDADSTYFAPSSCAEPGRIEAPPAGLALALVDNAPLALDRGQGGQAVIRAVIAYAPPDTAAAAVTVTGVDLGVTDAAGVAVAPSSRVSNVTIVGSHGSNTSVSTVDSTTSPLRIALQSPATLAPGDSLTLDVVVDVAPGAVLSPMRFELADAAAVRVTDANSGAPVVASSSEAFPWRTRAIAIQDPAGAVSIVADDTTRVRVNAGQADVTLVDATVTQSGTSQAADALVTAITLAFSDSSGAPVVPGDAIRSLAIRSGASVLYLTESIPASGDRLSATLASPLVVPPGTNVDLRVDVDVRDFPAVTSLRARIVQASDVDARDANSGAPLAVLGVPAFPVPSRGLVIEQPAAGLDVSGAPLAPAVIFPGERGVALVRVTFAHPDTAAAAIRVDSLSFDLDDAAGGGVMPADVLAQFCVVGADTLARATALSSVEARVGLRLSPPIVLAPGARDSVTVYVDARSPFPPGALQVRLERAGIAAFDVNDGSRILGIGGSFPLSGGVSALRLPGADVACGLVSRLVPNVTGREADLPAFDLVVTHRSAAGYADVDVRGVTVTVEDADGAPLDAGRVVSTARLVRGDSVLASASPAGGMLALAIPAGAARVAPGEADTLSLRVDLAAPDRAFRFALVDTAAVDLEAVGAGAVPPVPEGGTWPLVTAPAQVLGTDPGRAFTNYPNPFAAGREATRVTFYLARAARVTLRVYTLWGERVTTLLDGSSRAAGLYQDVTWDGRTEDGHVVNNGVYFLVLDVDDAGGSRRLRRKVAVVR